MSYSSRTKKLSQPKKILAIITSPKSIQSKSITISVAKSSELPDIFIGFNLGEEESLN